MHDYVGFTHAPRSTTNQNANNILPIEGANSLHVHIAQTHTAMTLEKMAPPTKTDDLPTPDPWGNWGSY